MLQRRHIVSKPGMGYGAVVIPSGVSIPFVHPVQRRPGLPVIAVSDIIARGAYIIVLLIAGVHTLAAETAEPSERTAEAPERAALTTVTACTA